jgi:Ca2+-binding RTX toxin-like protein
MRQVALSLTVIGATLLLASGIALAAAVQCVPGAGSCLGTAQDDVITGTDGHDAIFAHSGSDEVYAQGGDDSVSGGSGADLLLGDSSESAAFAGDDQIFGGVGMDSVSGFGGSDNLSGSYGNDIINAEPYLLPPADTPPEGVDSVKGGRGDDTIYARDGVVDNIDCGTGSFDGVLRYDSSIDVVAANCEFLFP